MQCRELKTDSVAYGPLERAWQYRRASQSAQVTAELLCAPAHVACDCDGLRNVGGVKQLNQIARAYGQTSVRWGIYARVI